MKERRCRLMSEAALSTKSSEQRTEAVAEGWGSLCAASVLGRAALQRCCIACLMIRRALNFAAGVRVAVTCEWGAPNQRAMQHVVESWIDPYHPNHSTCSIVPLAHR